MICFKIISFSSITSPCFEFALFNSFKLHHILFHQIILVGSLDNISHIHFSTIHVYFIFSVKFNISPTIPSFEVTLQQTV